MENYNGPVKKMMWEGCRLLWHGLLQASREYFDTDHTQERPSNTYLISFPQRTDTFSLIHTVIPLMISD
jgi:hypothetical protein